MQECLTCDHNKLPYTSMYPKSLRMLIKDYQKIISFVKRCFLKLARIAHMILKILFFYCKIGK